MSFAAVLGSTADAAVAISDVHAYSAGLSFNLALRLRQNNSDTGPELHRALYGGRYRGRSNDDALLLGVEYPDGRAATNLGRDRPDIDAPPDRPTLNPGGGGGGGRSYDLRFWLSPRPGPGDLTIVCAWPSRGIAGTRTVIGADLIAAGVSSITELWPWEPEVDQDEPSPPPRPDVPPGSWFASHGPSD